MKPKNVPACGCGQDGGDLLAEAAREIVDVVAELETWGPAADVAVVRAARVADLIARVRAGRAA